MPKYFEGDGGYYRADDGSGPYSKNDSGGYTLLGGGDVGAEGLYTQGSGGYYNTSDGSGPYAMAPDGTFSLIGSGGGGGGGLSEVATANTATATLEGSGTEAAPLRATVRISGEEGNILESTDDGLFVPSEGGGGGGGSDVWANQPIGMPFPLFDHLAGVTLPPNSVSGDGPCYIKLSASDPFNDGLLSGQTQSGAAPNIVATAEVALARSPMVGAVVRLINTEERFLRAGPSGRIQSSANAAHSHSGSTSSDGSHSHSGSTGSAGDHSHSGSTNSTGSHTHQVFGWGLGKKAHGDQDFVGSSHVLDTASGSAGAHSHTVSTNSGGSHSHTVSIGAAGSHSHTVSINSAGGDEARPTNVSVTYYMRIA